ncbi:MAG: YtxH domain-containing protein [Chloroflexota bacterium]
MGEKSFSSWVSGFLLGGAVGAAVALLSAPQSGDETRTMLKERGMQVKDQVVTAYEDQRQRAEQVIGDVSTDVRERAGKLKDVGQEVIDEQRSALERSARRVKGAVQEEAGRTMSEQQQIMDDAARKADDAMHS